MIIHLNKILFWILIFILLVGCKKNETKPLEAYFAGEIINPSSDNVLLYIDNKLMGDIKEKIKNENFK